MKQWLPAALLLAAILLTGCAGPGAVPSAAAGPAPPGPMPACAGVGTSAAIPAGFPAGFPLPPGTVVTVGHDQGTGRVVIGAFIPSDMATVSAFLQRELLRGGYLLTNGDAEPGEAASDFTGNGYRGRWKVNDLHDCAGAVSLTVLTQRVAPSSVP